MVDFHRAPLTAMPNKSTRLAAMKYNGAYLCDLFPLAIMWHLSKGDDLFRRFTLIGPTP